MLYMFLIFFYICIVFLLLFFFFFSSRRRHTRCLSDWSSDVCSSDLDARGRGAGVLAARGGAAHDEQRTHAPARRAALRGREGALRRDHEERGARARRSEERRVGKECRDRWSPNDVKKSSGKKGEDER